MSRNRVLMTLACALLVGAMAAPLARRAAATEAVTRPSEDVTLSFVRPGRIARVLVKEGDAVAVGAVLMEEDDTAEKFQLEQLKTQAEDDVRILAAQAQLAQKKEECAKLEDLGKKGAVTQWDVARSRLDVTIAELSLRLARLEHAQDGLKYREAAAQFERMRLASPIAGRVETVLVQPGESADALQKVIRIVKVDPLWIDAAVPMKAARSLKLAQAAEIEFDDKEVVKGKITHIAAVADSASDTRTVRIEVQNPAGRPAGERVQVRFPNP